MILGRYLITLLGLNFIFSYHAIEAGDGTFEGSTSPMVYLSKYEFKDLNTGKITPKHSFINAYIDELSYLEILYLHLYR